MAALDQDDEMSSDGEKETAISHTSKQGCPDMTQPDIDVTVNKARKKKKSASGKKFRLFSGVKETQGRSYVQPCINGRRKGALRVRQW